MIEDSPSPIGGLLAAYLSASYRIVGADGTDDVLLGNIGSIHEDRPSSGRVHAMVTACNPRSLPASDGVNRALMKRLERRLDEAGIATQPALAGASNGGWQEPSFWLRDIDVGVVDALAEAFDQNASVVVESNGRIVLRLHRADWCDGVGDDPRWRWAARTA